MSKQSVSKSSAASASMLIKAIFWTVQAGVLLNTLSLKPFKISFLHYHRPGT